MKKDLAILMNFLLNHIMISFHIYMKFSTTFIIKDIIMEQDLLGLEIVQKTNIVSSSTQSPTKAELFSQNYHFTVQGMPPVISKRVNNLVNILNASVVNIARLKECLAEGIPDEASNIREYSWKLILGYLPPEKNLWNQYIEKQTKTYDGLVQMFLPESKFPDYPLILKKDHARFKELEEDYMLWEQIQKDTSRTHAEFSFFATSSSNIMIPYLTSARRQKFKLINGDNEITYKQFLTSKEKQRKTYRYDYMTRILYIYSKLNPRIQYVQGMNEILAPIFYLVNVTKPANRIEEASCFYMFNSAISDIIDLHIKDLDKSGNGIYGKLNQVNQMLVVIEPLIWSRLEKLKIDPFFYCFRWVTLLYAQDFDLFDTLRIWESIFSSEDHLQFINFFAIAIIMSCKDVIINNQFTVVLEHLQNIKEHIKINKVIEIANELFLQFRDKDFKQHAKRTKNALEKKQKNEERQHQQEKNAQGSGKIQKKIGSFFKKVNNMFDKYF